MSGPVLPMGVLSMSCRILLLWTVGNAVGTADATRGVNAADEHKYAPVAEGNVQVFRCLNSTETVPHTAVNDDYCDCRDGTDEPGTEACSSTHMSKPDAKFFCANEKSVARYVYPSRVNDGICCGIVNVFCAPSFPPLRGLRTQCLHLESSGHLPTCALGVPNVPRCFLGGAMALFATYGFLI